MCKLVGENEFDSSGLKFCSSTKVWTQTCRSFLLARGQDLLQVFSIHIMKTVFTKQRVQFKTEISLKLTACLRLCSPIKRNVKRRTYPEGGRKVTLLEATGAKRPEMFTASLMRRNPQHSHSTLHMCRRRRLCCVKL